MPSNPLLGVFFHWLGGLASASFYVPYKRVRGWAWEVYWLAGGIFSWVIAPWVFASLRTAHLWQVLSATPPATLAWCWFWGVMWGFGGLTYGLAMRYLGMSLGMSIILGLTMVIGTLAPPLFHGTLALLANTGSGWITFAGIALAMGGVIIVARAGRLKERELSAAGSAAAPAAAREPVAAIAEYNFPRGILVALFSGVMSSCFAFGLDAGTPIRTLTLAAGTSPLSQGLPVLCVVLAGGFTTNFAWCLYLIVTNRTARDFVSTRGPSDAAEGGRSTAAAQLSAVCARRHGLVFPILLLHHGREPDGRLCVLELDAAHGEHHHLRHPVGICVQGMGTIQAHAPSSWCGRG